MFTIRHSFQGTKEVTAKQIKDVLASGVLRQAGATASGNMGGVGGAPIPGGRSVS